MKLLTFDDTIIVCLWHMSLTTTVDVQSPNMPHINKPFAKGSWNRCLIIFVLPKLEMIVGHRYLTSWFSYSAVMLWNTRDLPSQVNGITARLRFAINCKVLWCKLLHKWTLHNWRFEQLHCWCAACCSSFPRLPCDCTTLTVLAQTHRQKHTHMATTHHVHFTAYLQRI